MNKVLILLICTAYFLPAFGQGGDVVVTTDSDRSIEPSFRIADRPTAIDTTISPSAINYPLLVLQEQTSIEVDEINAATLRLRPKLSQLYRGYAKIGVGSLLQGLGEVYYNSLRSRRFNWGVHAKHHSEWGRIKDFAPSQYDKTSAVLFGKVEERRFSYGGAVDYSNQGLHYYGFRNTNADKDSIKQRFQGIGFNGFFDSHRKDSSILNYRIGLEYNNFLSRKPKEDTLKKWRARENFVGVKTTWQYNGSSNVLLSNLRADVNLGVNNYKYGIKDSSLTLLDTGYVNTNTLIQIRPLTSFYGLQNKLHFKVGVEFALDFHDKFKASLYPIAEVRYSLFNDIFIPYAGIEGGRIQNRFERLAEQNEFISSNQELRNESQYEIYFGFKGTVSSKISFNIEGRLGSLRDHVLFVNDYLYSSGNQFRAIYDTINRLTLKGSISYQQNEKLKVDLIGKYHFYKAKNNPFAWNLPQFEIITRGAYNIQDKLIATVDFTLETGRRAWVFDPTLDDVEEVDGIYAKKLGVIPDLNIGAEYRFNPRMSIFINLNNVTTIGYKRWFDVPVNGFQAMGGMTFRF